MNTLYLDNSFPDVIEEETENIVTDKFWFTGIEFIKRHSYNKDTLTYEGEIDCQASPSEPGKYLYPEWSREESPMDVIGEITDKQEYWFNKEINQWDVRPSIFTNPVYEKRSGALVETPIDSNRDLYTFKKPINSICSWSESDDDWVIDPDKAKTSFIGVCQSYVYEENGNPLTLSTGKTIPGVGSLNDYIVGINTTQEGSEYCVQDSEANILYLSRDELKEAIDILKVKKSNILKASSHYQTLCNGITDLESVYEVLDSKSRASSDFTPTPESVKLLSKLVELLNKKDN